MAPSPTRDPFHPGPPPEIRRSERWLNRTISQLLGPSGVGHGADAPPMSEAYGTYRRVCTSSLFGLGVFTLWFRLRRFGFSLWLGHLSLRRGLLGLALSLWLGHLSLRRGLLRFALSLGLGHLSLRSRLRAADPLAFKR